MSAEILRRAAALMRERAEVATPGAWVQNGFEYDAEGDVFTYDVSATASPVTSLAYADSESNAAHIASWHPLIALGVAKWPNRMASGHEGVDPNTGESLWDSCLCVDKLDALDVARAYLGESDQ